MVTLSAYQTNKVLKWARKGNDELWFYSFASNNVGLYACKTYCIQDDPPYPVEYSGNIHTVGPKTGYTIYTINPSISATLTLNRRNTSSNLNNAPKCLTTGSWDVANPVSTTRTWDRVIAPTSYGSQWLAWLTNFSSKSSPYWRGQDYSLDWLYLNDFSHTHRRWDNRTKQRKTQTA